MLRRAARSRTCDRVGIDQPEWQLLTSQEDALAFCSRVGYPCLVRPSYVLSGAAMNVAYSADELTGYLGAAAEVSRGHTAGEYAIDAADAFLRGPVAAAIASDGPRGGLAFAGRRACPGRPWTAQPRSLLFLVV